MSADDYYAIRMDAAGFGVAYGFDSDDFWPELQPDAPRFTSLLEAIQHAERMERQSWFGTEFGVRVHPECTFLRVAESTDSEATA